MIIGCNDKEEEDEEADTKAWYLIIGYNDYAW